MKGAIFSTLLVLLLLACGEQEKPEEIKVATTFNKAEILSDFKNWNNYYHQHTKLSSQYTSQNINGDAIDRETFLNELTKGKFFPVASYPSGETKILRLDSLGEDANRDIVNTIKNFAEMEIYNMSFENKPFPKFEFTSISGEKFNNKNTLGKKILFKTWFIGCKACLEEMPVLNKFVDENKEFLYISLALDNESRLKSFLEKRTFKYEVVGSQQELIQEKLKLNIYPTHLIVDESGVIKKVFNDVNDLLNYMKLNN